MTADIEDILGLDTEVRPKKRKGRGKASRGDLHDVLTRALPDLVDAEVGVCNLHKLSKKLGMTFQGVYKWFKPGRPNRLPAGQVDRIVKLSEEQTTGGPKFKPATRDDFWPFITT